MELKDLQPHLEAIKAWAAEKPERTAICLLTEVQKNAPGVNIAGTSLLTGRGDRKALTIAAAMRETDERRKILNLVHKAAEEELLFELLCLSAADIDIEDNETDETDGEKPDGLMAKLRKMFGGE